MEADFTWKQLKVDYSKNIWKEDNRGHGFASRLAKYKGKKIIENYNSVGAGVHKVGKVVSFRPKFDPNFPGIWKVWNR